MGEFVFFFSPGVSDFEELCANGVKQADRSN